MKTSLGRLAAFLLSVGLIVLCAAGYCPFATAQSRLNIYQTTLEELNQLTPEITTEEMQAVLASGRNPVFDVRSELEYAIAHIPGTINLFEKEAERIQTLYSDRSTPLTLYCNGPFCGKSKRTSEQLIALGYTNIKRYQLGLPLWRALGNTVQTDLAGVVYAQRFDRSAIFVDARSLDEFAQGSIPGAVSIRAGEADKANEDGRLPLWDKGTRVIVFGKTPEEARTVAVEIAKKAYWNSSYFGGTFKDLNTTEAANARVLTMDAEGYCAGNRWTLAVTNAAPNTPIRLMGASNGVLWELDRWAMTDSNGSFRTSGIHPSSAVGTHTVRVEIGGLYSNGASFMVANCR